MDMIPNGNRQKFCVRCGSLLAHSDDLFCTYCGARQEVPQKRDNALIAILKSVAYIILFYLIQGAVTSVAMIVIMVRLGAMPSMSNLYLDRIYTEIGKCSWICGIVEAVLLIGILAVFFAIRRKNLCKEISLAPIHPASFGGLAACGAGAQFAAVLLLTILYSLLPFLADFSVSDDLENMLGSGFLLNFLYIAVLTPLMEEIVFRGLVYTRLRRAMKPALAIVLSGLIFGAAHLNFEQFLYAAPLGILMAAAFEKYNTVLASFAIHFAFNGGNLLAGYIPEKPEALPLAAMLLGTGVMVLSIAFIFSSSKGENKRSNLPFERNF